MALDAWVNHSGTGAWDYNSSSIAEVYQGHLEELKRIEAVKPTSSHAILHKIFSYCVYVLFPLHSLQISESSSADTPGAATRARKKTKTDTANLPDTFSD